MKRRIYEFLLKVSRIGYLRNEHDECYYIMLNSMIACMLSWKDDMLYVSLRYANSASVTNYWVEVLPGEYIREDIYNSELESLAVDLGNTANAVLAVQQIVA